MGARNTPGFFYSSAAEIPAEDYQECIDKLCSPSLTPSFTWEGETCAYGECTRINGFARGAFNEPDGESYSKNTLKRTASTPKEAIGVVFCVTTKAMVSCSPCPDGSYPCERGTKTEISKRSVKFDDIVEVTAPAPPFNHNCIDDNGNSMTPYGMTNVTMDFRALQYMYE